MSDQTEALTALQNRTVAALEEIRSMQREAERLAKNCNRASATYLDTVWHYLGNASRPVENCKSYLTTAILRQDK